MENEKQKTKYQIRNRRGMTLVETIVVLSIFAVLSLAISQAINSFYTYNSYTIAQSHQVDHARRGVEFLVRDLREMTYSDNGAFPLISHSTSSIAFYSDIDRDDSVEKVEYELVDQTLYKYTYNASGTPAVYPIDPSQTETISEYVHNDLEDIQLFTYYDREGNILSIGELSDVRHIDVSLVVNVDPVREPGKYHLRSSASLRNLKEYDN